MTALAVGLTGEEETTWHRHGTENAAAHDAYLQGWARYKLQTPEDLAAAVPFLEEALRLDAGYAQAHALLAALYWDVLENDWAFDLDMPSSRAEALANSHLEEALEDPVPLAHVVQSKIYASLGSFSESFFEDAVSEARKAIALDANDATALAGLADALVKANRPGEGLDIIQRAIRLDPHHPPSYLITLGASQFGMERFEEAVSTLERAVKQNPDNELAYIYLASTLGHRGHMEQADDVIEALNVVRNRLGFRELSLRDPSTYAISAANAQIDLLRFGSRPVQQQVTAALAISRP